MRKLTIALLAAVSLGAAFNAFAAETNPLHPSYRVLDADRDGSVAAHEFMGYMTKMWDDIQLDPNPLHPSYFTPAQFQRADANGDMKISRDEYMAFIKASWAYMDRDGAGKVPESVYASLEMNPLNPNYRRN